MVRISDDIRQRAVALRKEGKTYGDISNMIGPITKSTLSYWLHDIILSRSANSRLQKNIDRKLLWAQQEGSRILKERRNVYFLGIEKNIKPLFHNIVNPSVAKLILIALYLAEGAKTQKGSLSFGNSDPGVIALFLHLLRFCYKIDETKFRCTIQGRADQRLEKLQQFWSKITKIPRSQFYAFRIDPRSRGKKTIKKDYKGVCRIDYFSAQIFHELMIGGRLLCEGR